MSPDEYYELRVRYTHEGVEIPLLVHTQDVSWWVDEQLYGKADQETEGLHYWGVRLVRKTIDSEGNETYVPIGPWSEEWTFFWR